MKSDAGLWREKRNFQRGVLELILYSSITEKDCELPTIKEFILSELVSATSEYITGEEIDGLAYRRDNGLDYPDFERILFERWQKIIKESGSKINLVILETITELAKPSWHSDQTGDGEYETDLYNNYQGMWGSGICNVIMSSIFSLPLKTIKHIENEVVPNLPENIIKDCKEIGVIMRKYINKDLEYIRRQYHW